MPSLTKAIGIILPLASILLYKLDTKGPHATLACGVLNIGCLKLEDIPIQGYVDEEYEFVKDIFINNFVKGLDVGAAITAYVNGKQVLSLQGGWQDVEKDIPYTNETLQMVYSSTKTLGAIVAAKLVESGVLDYDERISTYWPEFAQGNKENVTVEDLLRHTAGVSALDQPLSFEQATDPKVLSDILARQPHQFDGKPVHAYHGLSQGFYLNQVVQRADPQRRTVDDVVQMLNKQYNIEWYLKPGNPGTSVDPHRISSFYEEPMYQKLLGLIKIFLNPKSDNAFIKSVFDKKSLYYRSINHVAMDQVDVAQLSSPKYRVVENSAYSGFSNADSLGKLAAMMANKGKAVVEGEPDLLGEEVYNEATKSYPGEMDEVLKLVMHNQRGGFLEFRHLSLSDKDAFFEGGCGAGGSLFLYNREYNIAFSYVMNAFGSSIAPDERTIPMLEAIFDHVKNKKSLKQ